MNNVKLIDLYPVDFLPGDVVKRNHPLELLTVISVKPHNINQNHFLVKYRKEDGSVMESLFIAWHRLNVYRDERLQLMK